jgi:hypothetical protein
MKKAPWGILIFALVGIALWAASWALMMRYLPGYELNDFAKRGQFGDMFGAVNSLFTSMAMAAALYTIYLQHKELQAQREEQAKNEQARDAQMTIFSEQLKALKEQNQMEKEKQHLEALPVFHWRGGSTNLASFRWDFVNKGGRFKILRVIAPEGIHAAWAPLGHISPEELGHVQFTQHPSLKEEFQFEIEYENRFEKNILSFRHNNGQGEPVQVRR